MKNSRSLFGLGLFAALAMASLLPAQALSPALLGSLGLSPKASPFFTRLYANDSAPANDKGVTSVEVANLEGVTVFRVAFRSPFKGENALVQLYLDLDNNAATGRTGHPAYNGVDAQLAFDRGRANVNFHPGGREKIIGDLKVAVEDRFLYYAAVLRLAMEGSQASIRMALLCEQNEPRKAFDSFSPRAVKFPYAPPPESTVKQAPAAGSGASAPSNGSFEFGEDAARAGWGTFSRDAKVKLAFRNEAKHGKRSLEILHEGERDFNVENARIDVKPGSAWMLKIWAKAEVGTINLNAYTLFKGKTVRWDSALPFPDSHASEADGGWKELTVLMLVPEGVDQICPRVVGTGKVRALIDDLRMSPAPEELSKGPSRPKVEGFAKSRLEEKWDRGLIALRKDDGVYVAWRLLNTDAPDTAFHIWRSEGRGAPVKLTQAPHQKTTDWLDKTVATGEVHYWVVPVSGGKEGAPSEKVASGERQGGANYLSIPMPGPVQKVGVIDLDGDGRHDFVVKHPAANGTDPCIACNYWKKSEDTYKIEARRSDGKRLWVHDMGRSIEMGIWYSPYVVWDFNGDGVPEVACKGSEGDHRDEKGLVGTGPEWVFILDGRTGKEITRAPWPSRQGLGDYNLFSRNQCGIAYLDGKTPALILARGTYTMMKCEAWQLRGTNLEKLWAWTSLDEGVNASKYIGQGAHTMHCADIDGDGRDEVILGACVLDDNGRGLWSTGRGHPDHAYLGDIDPLRPGLEIYYGHEFKQPSNGMCLVDAKTGELLWGLNEPSTHIHSTGFCGDIDPNFPGMECWGGESPASHTPGAPNPFNRFLFAASGELIAKHMYGDALQFFGAYWDADLQREIVTGGKLVKYPTTDPVGRIEGSVVIVADILGDWREEVLTTIGNEMRIYTTTIPARDRRVTLLQDRIYRNNVAHTTMGYIQGPTTSYCLDQSGVVPLRLSLSFDSAVLDPGKSVTGTVRLTSLAKAADTEVELSAPAGVKIEPSRVKLSATTGKPAVAAVKLTRVDDPGERLDQRVVEVNITAGSASLKLECKAGLRITDQPVPGGIALEAEAMGAQGGGEVKVRTDKIGPRGACISHWDNAGHWFSWKFKVEEEGDYQLALRYCIDRDVSRKITLDGEAPFEARFPSSGGLSANANEWRHAFVLSGKDPRVFRLKKGEHTLRMENGDGQPMNLDYAVWLKK
jgi:rhamnogalacturonan endolyase